MLNKTIFVFRDRKLKLSPSVWKRIFNFDFSIRCLIKHREVMATLGPGWQMLDSFGFWWTWVNEIRNLSSFLQGGLNGGVRFYPTWYFALKNGIFQVKCRCHYAKKLVSWARDFKFWLQPCFFEPVKSAQNIKLSKIILSISSRFYAYFILILSRFYPYFIWIKSG